MSTIQQIQYYLGNPLNWAMILLALFHAYMTYSVFLNLTGGSMDPEYVNGRYQVFNHGNITYFTEEEYQVQHRLYLRLNTGFLWDSFRFRRRPWRLGASEGIKLNGMWDNGHRFWRVCGLTYGVKGEV